MRYEVGTRLYVRVAGPVTPALQVDRIDGRYTGVLSPVGAGTLDADVTLVNSGNIRLNVTATIRVSALFGLWSTEADSRGQDMTDMTTIASEPVVVWAVPWTMLLVLVLLAVAVVVAVRNLRRRRRLRTSGVTAAAS